MRYLVLACDYDGTLAHHGRVAEETLAALERLQATGRRLVLVAGRVLDELRSLFPDVGLFEWVVAENGTLLYQPSGREERRLAEPPPGRLLQHLRERGVAPLEVGRVVVATWRPQETAILDTGLLATLLRVGGEAAAERVLRDRPRQHELEQIVRPACLRADARQLEAAERLAVHQRPRDLAIDVQVADAELALHPRDVLRAARVQAARQRVFRSVGDLQSVRQVTRL
jgi:hydroxymethylpyrimidine pyrophosphatase-like HAD family hydrolase